jgi:hypothetical protein
MAILFHFCQSRFMAKIRKRIPAIPSHEDVINQESGILSHPGAIRQARTDEPVDYE